jgi:hypothetical protein
MIEGDLMFGDLLLQKGDYHVARKGYPHGRGFSPSGCVCFITAAVA